MEILNLTDEVPTNKVSIYKKHTDLQKPMETTYEIKLESVKDSVDDLILKAKEAMSDL
jgi:hypothetical protein